MDRRNFLTASLAASAVTLAGNAAAAETASTARLREFYQLRRYNMMSGPQLKLTEGYFETALIPALTRMGMGPIGAFKLDVGPDTPTYYLLIPSTSAEKLVTLDLTLAKEEEFLKAAEPFWNSTSTAPAFQRVESSMLAAFEGWPRVTPPASAATKAKRMFQMRTYESPSYADHVRKVDMFHNGEFDIFTKAGFHPVFFGDTLIGPHIPNLTYMLSFADMAELEAQWNTFRNDPAWKKLSTSPRYAFDQIVTNISNLYLSPLGCSQI